MLDALFKKRKRARLFTNDMEIVDIKLTSDGRYQFSEKREMMWPLIQALMLPVSGGLPYVSPITENGTLDPFELLNKEDRTELCNGRSIAKEAIRKNASDAAKQGKNHTVVYVIGICCAMVFVMVVLLVLLLVKGKLGVR